MNRILSRATARSMSVGARLTLLVVGIVALGVAALTVLVTSMVSHELETRAREDLERGNRAIIATVNTFSGALLAESDRFLDLFESYYPGTFTVDDKHRVMMSGHTVPALLHDGKLLNGDFSQVDEFSSRAHVVATLFVRDGPDFIRVSTSLKKDDGSRAVGTVLDPKGKVIALINKNEAYYGEATILGKPYLTCYEPMHDAAGNVIGIYYVGYLKE